MTLNQDVGVVLIMITEFFVAIIPPTVTHQEKKVSVMHLTQDTALLRFLQDLVM